MAEEGAAGDGRITDLADEAVVESFACYQNGDHALIPHKNRIARWMFLHSWLLPLLMLVLAILFSFAAVMGADNRQVVMTMMRVYGPRVITQDCSLTWYVEDERWVGNWYGRVVCDLSVPDGEREWALNRAAERVSMRRLRPSRLDDTRAAAADPENEKGQYQIKILFTEPEWTSFYMSFLTVTLGIPLLLSLLVMTLLVATLARKVPRSFVELAAAGRLQPGRPQSDNDLRQEAAPEGRGWRLGPRSWQQYAQDLDRALQHPFRFLFYAVWQIALLYFAWSAVAELRATDTKVIWSTVYAIVVILIGSIGYAYVIAFSLWFLLLIAYYLRHITPVFTLDIQPEHGDRCGGLGRLGQISFIIALVIVIPMLVFAIMWWMGLLTIVTNLFLGSLFLLSVLIIVAPLVFFGPLWRVHTEMSAAKARYQDRAIAAIVPFEQDIRQRIVAGQLDEAEPQKLDRELARLRALYPMTHKYPTWPFSTGQLLAFLSGQFLAVLTVVQAVVEFGDLIAEHLPQ